MVRKQGLHESRGKGASKQSNTLFTHSAQAVSPNTPIQGRSVHERKNNEIIDKGKKTRKTD